MTPTHRTRAALATATAVLREAEAACTEEIGAETAGDLSRCRRLVETWTGPGMWLDQADAQLGERTS